MMDEYIQKHGYQFIESLPLDGDVRGYVRIEKNNKTALCMNVAGNIDMLRRFVSIAEPLSKGDIRIPQIYDTDIDRGLAIIEDLGSTRLSQIYSQAPELWYGKAFDLLAKLREVTPPDHLQTFDSNPISIGRRRIMDWYAPAVWRRAITEKEVQEYLSVWDSIERTIPEFENGLVHADFHLDNIMVLDDGQLALIDFQDAVLGDPLYDWINILEDMRIDVPQNIYLQSFDQFTAEERIKLRVLGTIFHCRLLGQCLRWAIIEDKYQYLSCLPRLENYMRRALQSPCLAPLKEFFNDTGLDFNLSKDLNIDALRSFISVNAY